MTDQVIYYRAESEDGRFVDNPSEDTIYMLLEELNLTDNTFVTIEPVEDDPAWYVSISLLAEGRYEVEYRDVLCHEHQLITETDRSDIARGHHLDGQAVPRSVTAATYHLNRLLKQTLRLHRRARLRQPAPVPARVLGARC
jgi:hypothetical protein